MMREKDRRREEEKEMCGTDPAAEGETLGTCFPAVLYFASFDGVSYSTQWKKERVSF
jgi:hypothetical protein